MTGSTHDLWTRHINQPPEPPDSEGWIVRATRHNCADHRPTAPGTPGALWRCRCGHIWRTEIRAAGRCWYRMGLPTRLRYRNAPITKDQP